MKGSYILTCKIRLFAKKVYIYYSTLKSNHMAIKSFQGVRSKEENKKKYNAPILVEDYMTKKLITFSPDQSILEVMETFAKHHISGGPVVDNNGFW